MKKILMAVAVVALAASTQAAAFVWKTSTTGKIYQPGTSTTLATGTAYIFDAAAVSQATLFASLMDGADISTLGALDSSAIASGAIAAKASAPFSWDGTSNLSAYIAIVDGNNFYIGGIKTGAPQDVGATQLSFNEASASKAVLNTTGAYAGAGWYQAVPEPTSGLLMLVGLGALALRRRRA